MFDRVVVVDWSAKSTPKRGADSIWVCRHDAGGAPVTQNVPTRVEALSVLFDLVTADPSRTLVAVDFSLGCPRGTAAALGLTGGEPWAATWAMLADRVSDDDRNGNNRFELASELNAVASGGPGPFWGCPTAKRTPTLTSTKVDPDPLPTWRHTEQSLREQGHRPFSCWQLLGAGAVGSQSLLGIAAMRRLVARLAAESEIDAHVWPFTTGLGPPLLAPWNVVLAEVWPSMFDSSAATSASPELVKDEIQVTELARLIVSLDDVGDLDALFFPDVADGDIDAVVAEEGWVLGAGTDIASRSSTDSR